MSDKGDSDVCLPVRRSLFTAVSLAALCCSAPALASSCEDLAGLKLPDTAIEAAQTVPAGDYMTSDKITRKAMPPFCRVVASVKGAPDQDIQIEVWLPKDQWKGVFHANGNGGYAGIVSFGYDGMEAGVKRGYASASTDMGTAPSNPLNGDSLVGHPQKWKDWGLLSTHVMTVTGKEIGKAFYGEEPKHSYFTGCSTGGQQALIEAQYYPNDYDGIIVGAPVVSRTWGHAAVLWDYLAANLQPGHKLSDAKLALLTKSAVAACAGKSDGLKSDAFIADPGACDFDASALTCKGGDSVECLTPAEVETAKAFYTGPVDPHTGKALYYGWPPGSESGSFNWGFLEAPANAPGEPSFDGLFKWVFGADWNWRNFDFDKDMAKVDATLGPVLNGAVSGDVSQYHSRGGKLLIYQGWADPIVAPDQTIALYKGLAAKFGDGQIGDFARLFMAPGVGHCGGGDGANSFNSAVFRGIQPPSSDPEHDIFAALAHWVENGSAPAQVVATKYVSDDPSKGIAFQRPLCPYPQKPWYKGTGETNDAGNFTCAVTKP
jgi:feruloyl esterase